MTILVIATAVLAGYTLATIRAERVRRRERLAMLLALSRTIGIAPAVKAGRALGWLRAEDVRSDGDNVQIRVQPWRPFRRG